LGAVKVIRFTVPAVPVAQPRPKATRRGNHAAVYNPKGPVDVFKATVRLAASEAYQGAPLECPLGVSLTFVFPRTNGQVWKRKPMPRLWHGKKPDRDNLDKAVLDSLTGILWRDDAQVCDGRIRKLIASGDEQPHVDVFVYRCDEASAR